MPKTYLYQTAALGALLTMGVALWSAPAQAQAQPSAAALAAGVAGPGIDSGPYQLQHRREGAKTPEELEGTLWDCDPEDEAVSESVRNLTRQGIADGYNTARGEVDNVPPPMDPRAINCVENLLSQRFIPPTIIGAPPSLADLIDEVINRACEEVDKMTKQLVNQVPQGRFMNDDLGVGVNFPGMRKRNMDTPILPTATNFNFGGLQQPGSSTGGIAPNFNFDDFLR